MNFTGSVEVDTINGVNLRVLDETTVKINRPAVVTAPKVFAQTVRVAKPGRLLVESINGMRIPHDLVTKSEPRVLAGTKTFLGNVRIRGDLKLNGTLDGVDLGDLVLTKGDQALCGQKTFVGRTKFDNLRVKDKEGDVNATLAVIHGNVLVTKTINNWPVEILLKDFVFKVRWGQEVPWNSILVCALWIPAKYWGSKCHY